MSMTLPARILLVVVVLWLGIFISLPQVGMRPVPYWERFLFSWLAVGARPAKTQFVLGCHWERAEQGVGYFEIDTYSRTVDGHPAEFTDKTIRDTYSVAELQPHFPNETVEGPWTETINRHTGHMWVEDTHDGLRRTTNQAECVLSDRKVKKVQLDSDNKFLDHQ